MRIQGHRVVAGAGVVVLVGLLVLAAALLLGRAPGTSPPPVAAPGATRTVPQPVLAPLTGLPVTDPDAFDHPAVAVKVSDVRQAHPQVGVDRADIVFVEPIGVAYTRLAAVFHSDVPDRVGPVRSVRPMDAALLSPMGPVLASTMAAEWVMRYVDEVADVDHLGSLRVDEPDAYVRDPSRPRPDDVIADPSLLLSVSSRTDPPRPYFAYSSDLAGSSAVRASAAAAAVDIPYGPGWTVRWTYDEAARRYLREQPWGPHETTEGAQVSATNVLVLEVGSVTQKLGEGEGAPVPVLQLVDGAGSFLALSGGHRVTGTWSKGAVDLPFRLTTAAGDPLLLAPGTTWVEMPAPDAGVSVE
jgi:hypothetical protein